MSRRAVAVAVALVVVLSGTWIAVGSGLRVGVASSSEQPSATPTAGPFTLTLVNGNDVATDAFTPGPGAPGTLYFQVLDAVGTDKQVNITVADPNATRDGVADPAFTYEATLNTTTHRFDSYAAKIGYSIPSVPYNDRWNVTVEAPSAGSLVENFTVTVASLYVANSVGAGSTLPTEPISVSWSLTETANGGTIYTHATNVNLSGTYIGNGTPQPLFSGKTVPLEGAAAGHGIWNGTVPANATTVTTLDFELSVTAVVGGVVVENLSNNFTVRVGALVIEGVGLTLAPPTCSLTVTSPFPVGSTLAGCVQAGSEDAGFTAIPNLPVSLQYWNGTAHVTPSGAPTSLATNSSGEAAYTFVADSPPFSNGTATTERNAVNVTVTVPGAAVPADWTAYRNFTWTLPSSSLPFVTASVLPNHGAYYVGATAVVNWSASSSKPSVTGNFSATEWLVESPAGSIVQLGVISSTAASGSFSFLVTAAMQTSSGSIEIVVVFANASDSVVGTATAKILAPTIGLADTSNFYYAGTSVTVTVTTNGVAAGGTIAYQAVGTWTGGTQTIAAGTTTNGSSVSVPIAPLTPPNNVQFSAWATVGSQVVASASITLDLAYGYYIEFGVATVSSYSDGSFQPGQTVSLSYSIVSVGGAPLPHTVTLGIVPLGAPGVVVFSGMPLSGDLPYSIASSASAGTIVLELIADGDFTGECIMEDCAGVAALYINPSPSVLNLELGSGSGVTVGWLIVLVLAVVAVAGLLFLIVRRAGLRRGGSSGGSGGSPPEWKEPDASPTPASANAEPTPPPAGGS